jgi:hypothetical protein
VIVQHKHFAHRPFLLLPKTSQPYAITTRKWPKSVRPRVSVLALSGEVVFVSWEYAQPAVSPDAEIVAR